MQKDKNNSNPNPTPSPVTQDALKMRDRILRKKGEERGATLGRARRTRKECWFERVLLASVAKRRRTSGSQCSFLPHSAWTSSSSLTLHKRHCLRIIHLTSFFFKVDEPDDDGASFLLQAERLSTQACERALPKVPTANLLSRPACSASGAWHATHKRSDWFFKTR